MSPRPQLRAVEQTGMDETVVEIPELEDALEERQAAKENLAEHRKDYDAAVERANVEIEKLELPADGAPVRAGRFRITRSSVSARTVSFEAKATTRVRITVLGDDQ